MELIQEIGSYAGFAAVVGLAVLSALYFSQARDVRRLRDWAGRAPERSAQLEAEAAARAAAAAQRSSAVQARPQAKPAQAAAATATKPVQPGVPVVKPAQAVAAGAAPAVAVGAAQAGEKQEAGDAGAGEKAAADPPAEKQEKDAPGAQPAPVASGAQADAPPEADAGTAKPGAKAPAVPARGPGPATAAAAAGPGAASPPRTRANGGGGTAPPRIPSQDRSGPPTGVLASGTPKGGRLYRRVHWPAPRYVALLLAGVVIVGGGAAYGVGQVLSDEDPASAPAPGEVAEPPAEEDAGGGAAPAAVNPSTVTVSVLNGTTVGGLAAQLADKIGQDGFQIGNIDNALDQAKAESVVLYAAGARQEAREVARILGISQSEQIDPETQSRAGNASVVVIVGADQTR